MAAGIAIQTVYNTENIQVTNAIYFSWSSSANF